MALTPYATPYVDPYVAGYDRGGRSMAYRL